MNWFLFHKIVAEIMTENLSSRPMDFTIVTLLSLLCPPLAKVGGYFTWLCFQSWYFLVAVPPCLRHLSPCLPCAALSPPHWHWQRINCLRFLPTSYCTRSKVVLPKEVQNSEGFYLSLYVWSKCINKSYQVGILIFGISEMWWKHFDIIEQIF